MEKWTREDNKNVILFKMDIGKEWLKIELNPLD